MLVHVKDNCIESLSGGAIFRAEMWKDDKSSDSTNPWPLHSETSLAMCYDVAVWEADQGA